MLRTYMPSWQVAAGPAQATECAAESTLHASGTTAAP